MNAFLTPREVAIQWFTSLWSEHDESAIARLMAPGAPGHMEGGQEIVGPEEFVALHRQLLQVFPDLQVTIQDVLADDEKACVRWLATGTHKGGGLGIAATHRPHSFLGTTWMTVRDGKIVEGWDTWNQGGLLARMAAV